MGAAGAAAGVTAGFQLLSAVGSANAIEAEASYRKKILDINAKNAEATADRVIKKGDVDAANYMKKVRQIAGSQRAGYASQGVQVDTGSAKELVEETFQIGAQDAIEIKNNAFLEAMGYKQQSFNMQQQGRVGQISARQQSFNTLLAGGLNAANTLVGTFGQSRGGSSKGGGQS